MPTLEMHWKIQYMKSLHLWYKLDGFTQNIWIYAKILSFGSFPPYMLRIYFGPLRSGISRTTSVRNFPDHFGPEFPGRHRSGISRTTSVRNFPDHFGSEFVVMNRSFFSLEMHWKTKYTQVDIFGTKWIDLHKIYDFMRKNWVLIHFHHTRVKHTLKPHVTQSWCFGQVWVKKLVFFSTL